MSLSSPLPLSTTTPSFDGAFDGRHVAPILAEGRNCLRRSHAHRLGLLVDGCNYFRELEVALRKASRSIVILGWDFDGSVTLDRAPRPSPSLGELIRQQVEAKPDLEVRILVWSVAVIHAPSSPKELLVGGEWQDHPRIHLRLDTTHPIYAAHHQKICCIDGGLAFLGGMDLTIDRWDTPAHLEVDPRRACPDGTSYGPVHDIQMMVDGPAARDICDVALTRWVEATGETVRPTDCGAMDLWPEGTKPDFEDISVAISRAMPTWGHRGPVAEAPRLTADALAAARESIFIETQYLTAPFVGDILEAHLRRVGGPEIVCIVTEATHSKLERLLMGENRDRLVRRLARADHENRLRVYHPIAAGEAEGGCPILVHSKLIIIDDRFLRVGSSNLNNRSIGLDTEIDLAIEAQSDLECAGVLSIRNRLLAEHLGTSPDHVAEACAAFGSVRAAIDSLNDGARRLKPCAALHTEGPTRPVWFTGLLDPKAPFEPDWFLRSRFGGRRVSKDQRRRSTPSVITSRQAPNASGARK